MLSVENSPDPPCSCKVSGLKSDERASDKLALQEADLLKTSSLDDDDQLPTFSIRDYVFTARQKDIETTWPFHQHYLQLCLKHGIKDPLPPFEPPVSVRNRCFRKAVGVNHLVVQVEDRKSTLEVGLIEEEKVNGESNCINYESCQNTCESVLRSSDQAPSPLQEQEKLILNPIDTNLCRLSRVVDGLEHDGGEREDPSTVIFHAQSERKLVPTTTLSEASIELEVLKSPCAPEKKENVVEPSGKKCRLILKLGALSDPNHTEDITSNTTTVSDPMASKVCPVCKIFSSTSNTTLNAHIDQCLAVESTSKWVMNTSKLTKHRIKPRKMRSMVDICATAPRCTLEELDRRNGSNWAADLSLLTTAEAKGSAEGKRQKLSHVDLEDTGNESAVYFDSNGTKLRILSKFCDASVSTVGDCSKSRNHTKDGKQRKIISIDKEKCLRPKHSKYPKPKPQNKKKCSLELVRTKIHCPPEMKYGMEKNSEKEESLSELLKVRDHINRSESGTLGQWVCSKRTGSKKFNGKHGFRGLGCPSAMEMDSSIESNQSKLDNYSVKGHRIQKFLNQSENPISSPKHQRVESPLHGAQITDKGVKSHRLHESNLNQLTNGSTSSQGGGMLKLSRSSGNFKSSPRSKRKGVHTGPVENSNSLLKTTPNVSKDCHLLTSKGKQCSTLRNVLSVRPSFSSSKSIDNERCSSLKKSWMQRSITEMVEEVGVLPSSMDMQYDWMHDSTENLSGSLNQIRRTHISDSSDDVIRSDAKEITDELSNGRSNILKSRREIETSSHSGREEPMSLESSLSGSELCVSDLAVTVDSHVRVHYQQFHHSNNLTDKFDLLETSAEDVPLDEDTVKTFSKKDVSGSDIRAIETLVSEIQEPVCPDTRSNSLQSIDEFKRFVCGTEAVMPLVEQSSCDNQVICCAGEVGNSIIGPNSHMTFQMDFGVERSSSGIQYTGCRTDPIPISGSLLPSLGMCSEELPEYSSLTSSKIISSQDQHVIIDRDSSGSPISAMSTISHSTMARSDAKCLETESAVPPTVQNSFISGFSGHSRGPVVGDAIAFSRVVSTEGAERINLDGRCLRASSISPAVGSVKFTDDPRCCCSRKESISLGAGQTYQESQHPRQRTVAPVMLPSKGNQMTHNPNIRPEIFVSPSCPISRRNQMVDSFFESSRAHVPINASPNAEIKLPNHGDFSYASQSSPIHHPQSTSSPVLRLMGKNLMVVNKEEDSSVQPRQPSPGALTDCPNTKYLTLLGFSSGNVSNPNCLSFHHAAPEGSVIISQNSCNPPPPCFDADLSKGLKSPSNSKTRQTPPQPLSSNCNDMDMRGFSESFMQHVLKGRINLQNQQTRPINKPNSPFNVERVVAASHLKHLNPVCDAQAAGNSSREVIVIDDSAENEAESSMISAKYLEKLRGRQHSSVGILPPAPSYPNLRQTSAFSCHPLSNPLLLREQPVEPIPSYFVSLPRETNTSTVKQGGASEASVVPLQSPFTDTSFSTGRVSKAMYYSPS